MHAVAPRIWETTRQTEARTNLRGLRNMRVRGDGPPFAKCGDGRRGKVLYDATLVDEWLSARLKRSTSETSAALAMTESEKDEAPKPDTFGGGSFGSGPFGGSKAPEPEPDAPAQDRAA